MKQAFICDIKGNIDKVYPQNIRKRLSCGQKVYSKTQVLEDAAAFADTKYIFSTWGMPEFSEEEIKSLFPSLECVFYAAGSVQGFARPFLKIGVHIFSAWAANAVPVAEYTVAQILLAAKGFFPSSALRSRGEQNECVKIVGRYSGNYGTKVGLIGAGMIGKKVIELLSSFDVSVCVYDPFLSDRDAEGLGVRKMPLEKLFAECEVVSNHLANNEQTVGMLNYDLFSRMMPYSTFINTGRGAQVVEDDLVKHLTERDDVYALLDVTYPEPPKENHPFYSLDNCILTPHIAGSIGNEVHRMAEYMLAEYERYTSGQKAVYEISEKMLETMA